MTDPIPDSVDLDATRQNTSENAYYTVLYFLEGRAIGDEYWCPKNIAEYLNKIRKYHIAESTVRGVLKKLRKEGKVFCVEKGKIHLYASTRRFSNDFNYLYKNFGTNYNKERYQIHGLNLQLKAEHIGIDNFKNALPLGGLAWDDRLGKVMDFWDFIGGRTTVQLYRELLVVQVNCGGCPMDLDRFIAWLAQLDGWLLAKRWPRVEGNLHLWLVAQYGFNQDYLEINYDKPPVAITLQGFKNWFYRVYNKTLDDGTKVIRSEIHSKEKAEIPAFLTMASGSMSYVHVINLVQGTAHQMDNAVNRMSDIERALSRFAAKFEKFEVLEKKLQHLDDLETQLKNQSNVDNKLTFKRFELKENNDESTQ